MGDMPIYVAYDSVETWKYRKELFMLGAKGTPSLRAGVPPDAFSDDGQLWGNPVYDWDKMRKNGYKWWKNRINYTLELFDILRIDHFRGFDRFYAIPAVDDTARGGWWVDGPKLDFFKDKLDLKIVAEDLGVVDEGLLKLMNEVGYPGMKVLGFAFEGDPNYDHKPSLNPVNSIVYTGTHDNMTMLQHITSISEEELNVFVSDVLVECKKMGVEFRNRKPKDLVETVVELAFASKANLCIIPMQDFLLQGGESRMNFPSTVSVDNWSYRILKKHLNLDLNIKIRNLVKKLDNDLRQIVILYYFEDFSVKEISKIIQKPEGTVKSRLSRARKELEKALIKQDDIERRNSNG
jgi:4-alpha-glucanotransferase